MSQAISSIQINQMKAAQARLAGTSITIRRGSTTLAAQSVHLAVSTGYGQTQITSGAQEARGKVIVLGSTSFDVAVADRFNAGGILYRVTFVRPSNGGYIEAEAEAVE